jgi:hypothetical protein
MFDFLPQMPSVTPTLATPILHLIGPQPQPILIIASGRGRVRTVADESGEDGFEIEATIEAILHLGKMMVGILGKLERMVSPGNRVLEVGEYRVHAAKLGAGSRLPTGPAGLRVG